MAIIGNSASLANLNKLLGIIGTRWCLLLSKWLNLTNDISFPPSIYCILLGCKLLELVQFSWNNNNKMIMWIPVLVWNLYFQILDQKEGEVVCIPEENALTTRLYDLNEVSNRVICYYWQHHCAATEALFGCCGSHWLISSPTGIQVSTTLSVSLAAS